MLVEQSPRAPRPTGTAHTRHCKRVSNAPYSNAHFKTMLPHTVYFTYSAYTVYFMHSEGALASSLPAGCGGCAWGCGPGRARTHTRRTHATHRPRVMQL